MMFKGDFSVGDRVRVENYRGEETVGTVEDLDNMSNMVWVDGVKYSASNVVEVLEQEDDD